MKKLFLILLLIATPAYAETCFNIDSSAWTQEEKNLRHAGAYDLMYTANTANVPPSSVTDSQICFPSVASGSLNSASLKSRIDQIIADAAPTPEKITLAQRNDANNIVNDSNGLGKVQRAALLLTLDEINALRQWITDFKAQVALASSLNDLKTRVATLPNTPQRTALQLKNAIKTSIDNGSAD